MGDLLVALVPYGLAAAAAAPAAAAVAALVLGQAQRPIVSTSAFIAGALLLDIAFAAIVLAVMEGSGQFTSDSDIGAWVDTVLGAVFLLLGVMALFQKDDPAKDAARRERIGKLTSSGPAKLIAVGVVVQVINADALAVAAAGLKEVAIADVDLGESVLGVVWLLALVLLPYYVPLIMYLVAPKRSLTMLRGFSNWLLERSRVVEIVTGVGLGALFLWKGVAGLV